MRARSLRPAGAEGKPAPPAALLCPVPDQGLGSRGLGSSRVYCAWAGPPWGWLGDRSSEHPLGSWFRTGPQDGCWTQVPLGPVRPERVHCRPLSEPHRSWELAYEPKQRSAGLSCVCARVCACVSGRGHQHFSLPPAGRGLSSSTSTSKNSTTAPLRSQQPIT